MPKNMGRQSDSLSQPKPEAGDSLSESVKATKQGFSELDKGQFVTLEALTKQVEASDLLTDEELCTKTKQACTNISNSGMKRTPCEPVKCRRIAHMKWGAELQAALTRRQAEAECQERIDKLLAEIERVFKTKYGWEYGGRAMLPSEWESLKAKYGGK